MDIDRAAGFSFCAADACRAVTICIGIQLTHTLTKRLTVYVQCAAFRYTDTFLAFQACVITEYDIDSFCIHFRSDVIKSYIPFDIIPGSAEFFFAVCIKLFAARGLSGIYDLIFAGIPLSFLVADLFRLHRFDLQRSIFITDVVIICCRAGRCYIIRTRFASPWINRDAGLLVFHLRRSFQIIFPYKSCYCVMHSRNRPAQVRHRISHVYTLIICRYGELRLADRYGRKALRL